MCKPQNTHPSKTQIGVEEKCGVHVNLPEIKEYWSLFVSQVFMLRMFVYFELRLILCCAKDQKRVGYVASKKVPRILAGEYHCVSGIISDKDYFSEPKFEHPTPVHTAILK